MPDRKEPPMKHALIAVFALVSLLPLSWFVYGDHEKGEAGDGKAGEPKHGVYTPDDLEWRDGPPSIPDGAKMVLLEGDPSKEGYFAMRLQLPNGYKLPPHWHPNVERVTVIS